MAEPRTYPPPDLPEKYYLDYFNFILRYVETKYDGLLVDLESSFIKQFKKLSEDCQCLFLRMVMRRGVYFKLDTLQYKEISDLPKAITALKRKKFIHQITSRSKDEIEDLIPFFTKKDLIEIAAGTPLDKPSKSLSKPALISHLLQAKRSKLLGAIAKQFTVFREEKIEEVERLFFLFFGSSYRDISEFVVRDLGYRNFENHQLHQLTPYFKTRDEIDQKWMVNTWYNMVKEGMKKELPIEEIFESLKTLVETSLIDTFPAQRSLGRLLIKVGRDLERAKAYQQALWAFRQTDYPPSNEREIRVLAKLKQTEEAIQRCLELKEMTAHAEEYYFAIDFSNRLLDKKSKKSTTEKQNAGRSVTIGDEHKYRVEMGALEHLTLEGWNGLFSENLLWNSLFGLLFWEEIFDDQQDAFHHPFQFSPSDWRSEDFYLKRKEAIDTKLELVDSPSAFSQHLETVFHNKYSISNPLIFWYEELLEHLLLFTDYLTSDQMKRILTEMARNPKSNTKGFPDLYVWKTDDYRFIEIKSPNDKLSAQQLYWLDLFESIGIKSEVLNIKFSTFQ